MRYQPFYCEENVWHLCAEAEGEALAVFISNVDRQVALWGQRSAEEPGWPVFWDYHVILMVRPEASSTWQVWDLDTVIGLPVPAQTYLDRAFVGTHRLPQEFHPLFRLIPALEFHATFASDRRHMRNENGVFSQPEPPWAKIGQGFNLWDFVDMEKPFLGDVLNLENLRQRLKS